MAGNANELGRSVVSRVCAILLTVAEGGCHTMTEIATRCGLPLSTVHRLVGELAAWGILEREHSGLYRVTVPVGRYEATPGPRSLSEIRDCAVPLLEDLFRATGSAVRVGVLDGGQVAYVEKVSAHLPVSIACVAARLPAHATALGKVLLAFSPATITDAVLARGLRQYTSTTITSPDRLHWLFRRIRAGRLALCEGELDPDWSAVAAPVFGEDGTVAAIELRVRDMGRDLAILRPPLTITAGSLSRHLAGQIVIAPIGAAGSAAPPGRARLRSVPRPQAPTPPSE